jgi:hypothetical protein
MEDSVVAILIALRKQSSCHEEHRCNCECSEMLWTEHNGCPDRKLTSFYANSSIEKQERMAEKSTTLAAIVSPVPWFVGWQDEFFAENCARTRPSRRGAP